MILPGRKQTLAPTLSRKRERGVLPFSRVREKVAAKRPDEGLAHDLLSQASLRAGQPAFFST